VRVDLSDPRPAYVQIADDLREKIKNGALGPGDKMPARKDVALEYGVAPETVRRAQDELIKEGLIGTRSTLGVFVIRAPGEPEPSPEYIALADQLAHVAERMEELLARLETSEDQLREYGDRIRELQDQLRELRHGAPPARDSAPADGPPR
jgi:DNA-binding GntR family transcriptional regulator